MFVEGYEVRRNLLYTKEHEWAKIEDGKVRVGITDYAQKNLHEIVYVEMPKKGATVKQMEPMGTVESIKSVSEIYSPISGKIIEINEALKMAPELVNESPYEKGWMVVIEPSALDEEIKGLMTAEQYANFIKSLAEK
ncbi:glycine cleavage system protein GcvH [Candidatus Bathyarchaeota archaeon]|nr:glycine cleavage system protein GcvH [Candidatus Bathyarchaeota archaeon]